MRIKYEVSAGGLLLRPRASTYDALLIGRGTAAAHLDAAERTRRSAGIERTSGAARSPRRDGLLGRDRHPAQRDFVLVLRRQDQAPQVRYVLPDALPFGRSGQPRPRGRRGALVRHDAGSQDPQVREREAPGRHGARVSGSQSRRIRRSAGHRARRPSRSPLERGAPRQRRRWKIRPAAAFGSTFSTGRSTCCSI